MDLGTFLIAAVIAVALLAARLIAASTPEGQWMVRKATAVWEWLRAAVNRRNGG